MVARLHRSEGNLGLSLIGLGMLAILVGVSLLSPWLGRPLTRAVRARLPPRLRHRRHAGRAELPAQPAAYGGHRQRADDRADPGRADVDPRPVRHRQHGRRGQARRSPRSSSSPTSSARRSRRASRRQIRKVDGVRERRRAAHRRREDQGRPRRSSAPSTRGAGARPRAADRAGLAAGPAARARSRSTQTSAARRGIALGDTVPVEFQGGTVRLKVVALFGALRGAARQLPRHAGHLREGRAHAARLAALRHQGPRRRRRRRAPTGRPDHRAAADRHREGPRRVRRRSRSQQINLFLYFIYALLGLAVVIAVLGIINTLALSVIERTREVGLLRAVGLSPPAAAADGAAGVGRGRRPRRRPRRR